MVIAKSRLSPLYFRLRSEILDILSKDIIIIIALLVWSNGTKRGGGGGG